MSKEPSRPMPVYTVRLGTAGGDRDGLVSEDYKLVGLTTEKIRKDLTFQTL